MDQHWIVCISGLCGAGKSVVSDYFIQNGYLYRRFGQITMDELKRRNLPICEENERLIREELRNRYGMAAFAILNQSKLDELLLKGNVIVDGLYSFAEYKVLKDHYKDKLIVIAVYAPPRIRYERLSNRKIDSIDIQGRNRPLTHDEAVLRDYREIERSDKGGPIAIADYTIMNIKDFSYLQEQAKEIIDELQST